MTPKPSKRAEALTATATDGEGLSKEARGRIAHVMDKALEEDRQERSLGGRVAELEAKLARLRPIARAAVKEDAAVQAWEDWQPEEWDQAAHDEDDRRALAMQQASEDTSDAVAALSEPERSELLEEAENG